MCGDFLEAPFGGGGGGGDGDGEVEMGLRPPTIMEYFCFFTIIFCYEGWVRGSITIHPNNFLTP